MKKLFFLYMCLSSLIFTSCEKEVLVEETVNGDFDCVVSPSECGLLYGDNPIITVSFNKKIEFDKTDFFVMSDDNCCVPIENYVFDGGHTVKLTIGTKFMRDEEFIRLRITTKSKSGEILNRDFPFDPGAKMVFIRFIRGSGKG